MQCQIDLVGPDLNQLEKQLRRLSRFAETGGKLMAGARVMSVSQVRRDDVSEAASQVFELLDFDNDGLAKFEDLQKEFAGIVEKNTSIMEELGHRKVCVLLHNTVLYISVLLCCLLNSCEMRQFPCGMYCNPQAQEVVLPLTTCHRDRTCCCH